MDTNFGVLGDTLQGVSFGMLLLVDDYSTIAYINKEATEIFSRFDNLKSELISYTKLNSRKYTNDLTTVESHCSNLFILVDKSGKERQIKLESVTTGAAVLIVLEDVTDQYASGQYDELTDLGNRAYFEQKLAHLNNKGVTPVVVLFGDVNGLKLLNDVFGHVAGDAALIELAKILKSSVRMQTDFVSRWGGDEFAILLPNANEKVAKLVCARIKRLCGESALVPLKPSISMGYAVKTEDGEPLEAVVKRAESEMYSAKLHEATTNRVTILQVLSETLKKKSLITVKHIERLYRLAKVFGKALKLHSSDYATLLDLAIYHDIGNVVLSDELLLHEGKYSSKEKEAMKAHVVAGYRVVKAVPEFARLAYPILHHHENWDGSGYPSGIRGENINYLARVLRVLDSYEAMTAPRAYSSVFSHGQALEVLQNGVGLEYDPHLVSVFLTVSDKVKLI